MRSILTPLLLCLSLLCFAQDTITVRTLTFDSITTRRGWWQFPEAGHHYRKVLMVHTLKCDPQTAQDQYDCGEWDYLTYHFIHEHTGAQDSAALTHPYFLVGIAAPPSVVGSTQAFFHQHQRWEESATVTQVNTETSGTIGVNDTTDANTFQGYARRSQYIYTAAELNAAGVVAGAIKKLRFHPVGGSQAMMPRFVVRMKNTPTSTLSRFEENGLLTVMDLHLPQNGLDLVLTHPFNWDGISNILIDIANEGWDDSSPGVVEASHASAGTALLEAGRDDAIETNDDFVGVDPAALAGLNQAITITFRAFGAPQLPQNTSILEAVNAQGQRVLNIHLPWSDGSVYWDAGQTNGNYDRINKLATTAQIEGQWNDWAFVKNAGTGSMKIYLNGTLWHSGTGKTLPLSGIVRMRIASDANGNNPWPGMIDGFNLFNTEVSGATIATWHDRKVTSAHPDFGSLLYGFDMDEGIYPGLPWLANAANPEQRGWLMGTVKRVQRPATQLFRNPADPGVRPVLTFVQGDHAINIDSVLTADPLTDPLPQLSREYFAVEGNAAVPVDTVFEHSAGWSYTWDPQGALIDSVLNGGITYVNDTLPYFGEPFDVVNDHEIGRYITPYGIQLDLGPAGFSWVYDVTDYQWLMHDSVEISAGNQQELIDLRFLMIEGTPPYPVLNVQHPWGFMRSYSFASLSDDSELAERTVHTTPGAERWTLRSRLTGHGDASSIPNVQGCCEFRDNTHFLRANGQPVDDWHIWQTHDCATNAVYPQGGTWIYAREGWCPGDVVKERETNLTPYVQGDSLRVDYAITPVPLNNPGMGAGNYVVSMDLFEFGPATQVNDAEIYDVLRPTDAGVHERENPICYDPTIVLRNAGSAPLTSVSFSYQVSGGSPATYTWTGNLATMERVEVALPIGDPVFWAGDDEHHFTVRITDVNGSGADANADNDRYTTQFALPVIYPNAFVLYYKTNNSPDQNHLTVRNAWNTIVFERGTFTANTTYRDTLFLDAGCYTVDFTDSGDNGLSFWAEPGEGSGFFRFRSLTNQTLRTFDPDFGNNIHAAFAIGSIVHVPELERDLSLTASPVPNDGRFQLHLGGFFGELRIQVIDATGHLVHEVSAERYTDTTVPMDLSDMADGLYVVRLLCERGERSVRVMKGW